MSGHPAPGSIGNLSSIDFHVPFESGDRLVISEAIFVLNDARELVPMEATQS